ncbi:male-specific histamine-binding salivary protein-like isoform X3 [Dermacentor silvarum]|uniref:male-specific histamine-binding salivary protein-like isoform X3 n=1 Tax=Dermacentor silvarum TaxID=543639 RepID=UPI002101BBA4|nr:male-specific histamine-binding salivary protein-like isoform X3 [Dermacentor silvarum]
MKLHLVFLVLGVAHCTIQAENQKGTAKVPAWAKEDVFGIYQDAWQSIKQDMGAIYYLVKATYNQDDVWGTDFTCVTVTATEVSEEQKTIEATITFKNNASSTPQTSKETVTAVKMYDYKNKENAIEYKTHDDQPKTFRDSLVFTEEQSCDIFHVPYAKNTNGRQNGDYELWVHESKVSSIPPCCLFLFEYLAENRERYTVYNDDCKATTADVQQPGTQA